MRDRTEPAPPNIVLVMTDQHTVGMTAGEGFGLDTMPFLDSLAARGRRFRNAYTTFPACVPARTSLMTGRFPSTHRVRQNAATHEVVRGDDMLDVLRTAGYSLHFAGKPHVYRGPDDYDSYAGPYMHEDGPVSDESDKAFAAWMRSIDHGPATEPTPFPVERQFPYRIVSDAVTAVRQRDRDQPYFLWVSFPEPHNPYQVPEPYFSLFPEDEVPERACGPEAAMAKGGAYAWLRTLIENKRPGYDTLHRRYRANYCGMLRLIDDQLRRLVEHLGTDALDRDTVLLFVADHGDYVAEYGLQRKGAGVPEVLLRVPFVAVGPGIRPHDDTAAFVSLADVFPTVCEMAGQPIPMGVQGRSLYPVLTGQDCPAAEFDTGYAEFGFGGLPYGEHERPALRASYTGSPYNELNTMTQSGSGAVIRHGDWKLVYHATGRGELYCLRDDPMELHDRWDEDGLHEIRAALVERLARWRLRVHDELPTAEYVAKRAPHNWYWSS